MYKAKIVQPKKHKDGYIINNLYSFPDPKMLNFETEIINKAVLAERFLGKLDGITQTIPDIGFFLKMFAMKDATDSSKIEGTRATMADAIELAAGIETKETDANDIIHYLQALEYGLEKIKDLPISIRFIKEIHSKLLTNARSTHFSDPGNFRISQNWIGGTRPDNAIFVPCESDNIQSALSDIEKFIHYDNNTIDIIKIGLIHSQFETIHPFLDGNGRTGRLLITFLLIQFDLLENPVLFLSSYFKKHKDQYYEKLNKYHQGFVNEWLIFFLDGVIETSKQAIQASSQIVKVRDNDLQKIQTLAKRESTSTLKVLNCLFQNPIVNTKTIMSKTGFSRAGSQKVIDRMIDLDILEKLPQEKNYDIKYVYRKYLNSFF